MPVSVRFVLIDIGAIKNHFGRFIFCRKVKDEVSPLPGELRDEFTKISIQTMESKTTFNIQANTSARQIIRNQLVADRPPLATVLSYIDYHEGRGVALRYPQLPRELFNLFQVAGDKYRNDLKQYCSSVFFLPYIVSEKSGHVWGFEMSMAKASLRERMEFMSLTDPAFRNDINTAIFLNTVDPVGAKYDEDRLLLNFTWLVGHTKLSTIMSNRGIKESQLGEPAREYFSSWYRRNLLRPVLLATSMANPEYRAGNEQQLCLFDEQLSHQVKLVSRSEIAILEPIMKG